MNQPVRPDPDDWVSQQPPAARRPFGQNGAIDPTGGGASGGPCSTAASIPRRRRPSRRLDESRFQTLDWHAAHLLAVSLGILILNVADAFLTVALISGGAIEVNPVMAVLVSGSVAMFVTLKMAVTGTSVVLMVFLARYRFMRLVRVDFVLYVIFVAYAALIVYELQMLQRIVAVHEL